MTNGRVVELPVLDPRARETSFKEHFSIKKCYSKILGMNYIDHFSINVVPQSGEMLVFSIRPEIAYSLYSSKRSIEQDLAISPTFYNNFKFYFWDECYDENSRAEIMAKKEERFGIKSGAVIVHQFDKVKYLFSFGTISNKDNFRQDISMKTEYFEKLGIDCLNEMGSSISRHLLPRFKKKGTNIKKIQILTGDSHEYI